MGIQSKRKTHKFKTHQILPAVFVKTCIDSLIFTRGSGGNFSRLSLERPGGVVC